MQPISPFCTPMRIIRLWEKPLQNEISGNADSWLNQPVPGRGAGVPEIQQGEQQSEQVPVRPVVPLAGPLPAQLDGVPWLALPVVLPGDYYRACLAPEPHNLLLPTRIS